MTTGFSVSGSAVIVTLASAIAVLPLVSRAVAVTRIVAPTEATIGIEITRWYGGVLTPPGAAPAAPAATPPPPAVVGARAGPLTAVPGGGFFRPPTPAT